MQRLRPRAGDECPSPFREEADDLCRSKNYAVDEVTQGEKGEERDHHRSDDHAADAFGYPPR